MSFRWYLILMGVGTTMAWVSWIFVIETMNPVEAGPTAFAFFYMSLLLALVGTLSLAGLIYRIGVRKRYAVLAREVRISFRHAILLSLGGTVALWLSAHRSLSWYWLLLVVALIAGTEYIFLLIQAARRQ